MSTNSSIGFVSIDIPFFKRDRFASALIASLASSSFLWALTIFIGALSVLCINILLSSVLLFWTSLRFFNVTGTFLLIKSTISSGIALCIIFSASLA